MFIIGFSVAAFLAFLLSVPAWLFGRIWIEWRKRDYAQPAFLMALGLCIELFLEAYSRLMSGGALVADAAIGIYGFALLVVVLSPWLRVLFALLELDRSPFDGVRWILTGLLALVLTRVLPMQFILFWMFWGM